MTWIDENTSNDDDVVERTPLTSDGKTGAPLERLVLADGRVFVEKTVDSRLDWLMEATADDGRVYRLWRAGAFDQLPKGVDSAIVSVRERPHGFTVLMRDVSQALVPPGHLFTREQGRRVVSAAAALHDAFAGSAIEGLCPIVDRIGFLTPAAVKGIPDHPLRDIVLDGWSRFVDLVPGEIARAVLELHERPGALAAALGAFPQTLLHGDLKVANIGFEGPTVVLLDWGTLTGMGPRALDHAWYVAVNSAAVDASLDELLFDVEEQLRPEDREALPLALLAQVLLLGFDKALGATSDDTATRARESDALRWWCNRAAEALELWSPA